MHSISKIVFKNAFGNINIILVLACSFIVYDVFHENWHHIPSLYHAGCFHVLWFQNKK